MLNKADQVSEQQLLRVCGALMWSLGKVFMTPEVCKVYVGSFNTEPIKTDVNKMHDIFQMEHEALMADLMNIPAKSCDRKVNEFVKRTRALRTHMMIIGDLWKQMPTAFGHEKKQKKLLANIHEIPEDDDGKQFAARVYQTRNDSRQFWSRCNFTSSLEWTRRRCRP